MLAELAAEQAPENARTVFMSCNPGNLHTESRLQAYNDIYLEERSDVELLAEKITDREDQATLWRRWKTGYSHTETSTLF